jgi:hypothetical protein
MQIYTIDHRTAECTGVWIRKRSSLGSNLGTVTCDTCGMQYADTSAAVRGQLAENWLGLWISRLTEEGQRFLKPDQPVHRRF